MLLELLLGRAERVPIMTEEDAARTGRALVKGENYLVDHRFPFCHASCDAARNPSTSRRDPLTRHIRQRSLQFHAEPGQAVTETFPEVKEPPASQEANGSRLRI